MWVPKCDDVINYAKYLRWKEELWDKFYMDAPKQLRQCVETYKIVKRAFRGMGSVKSTR
jgi:hypothetical protein